jgi:hypothetical protein
MTDPRPFKLVAPWYYWRRQISDEHSASSPRDTRPTFQKFKQSDFVPGFLPDPQHSLKFKDEVDRVYSVNFTDSTVPPGPLAGKNASLYPGDPDHPGQKKTTLVRGSLRKIFLDTHLRYYAIVCELHCDEPGFPSASASAVCQAGFVIRRRFLQYPKSAEKPARALLKDILAIEAQIGELEQTSPARPVVAQKRALMIQKMVADGTFGPKLQSLLDQLEGKRVELLKWKEDNGVLSVHEGWVPSAFDKVGSWQIVDEQPQTITESYFPLYPLFANPEIPNHDAVGSTIFFGVLPTSTHDTDSSGKARFDDKTAYEVRCFVRRHDPKCPRAQRVPDCPGEVFWSKPTETYRLASQFDLDGTANRPITIHMPNLAELAAQVATKPFGKLSPMRFVQLQSLKPILSGKNLVDGKMGGFQVCFFAIPLITIVAFFVLQIFLPIVVLIFSLWFLLVLKFCIPPSLSIDGDLHAELTALAPKIKAGDNLDASFSVVVGPPVSGSRDQTQINDKFRAASETLVSKEGVNSPDPNFSGYSNEALRPLAAGYDAVSRMPQTDEGPTAIGLGLTDDLEYEVRVTERIVVT